MGGLVFELVKPYGREQLIKRLIAMFSPGAGMSLTRQGVGVLANR